MISKNSYNAIDNWNKKKNLKNFCMLYKHGFTYKNLWQRPLWRVWRIIRNTWIIKTKYNDIYLLDESKLK